jgi:hypothetical protein
VSEPDADGLLALLPPAAPGFDALVSVLEEPEPPVLPVLPAPALLLSVLAPLPVLDWSLLDDVP